MFAEILTIGDELTRGEIVDTNSSWLAAQLWDRDVTVRWMTSCRDDAADLERALREAAGRADVVLCSGGLGPTEDDLTVDVVSALGGVAPVVDEPSRVKMEALFASRGAGARQRQSSDDGFPRAHPAENQAAALAAIQLRQVRVPAGATVYANAAGLAPGFEVAVGGTPVICFPGVPREVHAIFADHVVGRLGGLRDAAGARPRIARRVYRAFGRGESQLSQVCRGLVDDVSGASIHYQVKFPEVLIKLVVRDPDAGAAAARLEALDAGLRARLGPTLYGTGDDALPDVTVAALRAAGVTVATAESCTGGMIGQLLTGVAGSSAVFTGGAIVYSNAEKIRQLGVRAETLEAHGAVSEACVREMAIGARERFGVGRGVAVSGIAGPDGGSPGKPVGLVWLACARDDGEVVTKELRWPGTRDMIRTLAAWWGLALLRGSVD